MKSGVPSWRP